MSGRSWPVTAIDHCPRRASSASTRGCGQRLITNGSVPGSTSTPSPGPRTTCAAPGGPAHADPALQHQHRRPALPDIDRPFGPAHGGDGLRRGDAKVDSCRRCLRRIDQQRLALQVDGTDVAILAALQRESCAILGDDGQAVAAAERLCRVRPRRRCAAGLGRLRRGGCDAERCADDGEADEPG